MPHKYPIFGGWVLKQRQKYKKGCLDEYKIKKLNAISFSWTPKDDKWYFKYNALINYKGKYGHFEVSVTFDKPLASWRYNQRILYKNNKLENYKIKLLEKINFPWTI